MGIRSTIWGICFIGLFNTIASADWTIQYEPDTATVEQRSTDSTVSKTVDIPVGKLVGSFGVEPTDCANGQCNLREAVRAVASVPVRVVQNIVQDARTQDCTCTNCQCATVNSTEVRYEVPTVQYQYTYNSGSVPVAMGPVRSIFRSKPIRSFLGRFCNR